MDALDAPTPILGSPKPPSCPSFASFISPFAWIAFLATALSVVGAIYILVFKVKFNRRRLWKDYHYTLRFTLALLLFINRSCNCIGFVLDYELKAKETCMTLYSEEYVVYSRPVSWDIQNSITDSYRLVYGVQMFSHVCFLCTVYTMMINLLFLTLDRYKRIHMVLPGTRMFIFMKIHVVLYYMAILIVVLGYTLDSLPFITMEGREWRLFKQRQLIETIVSIRKVTEGTSLIYGMILYYYFTFRLIKTSVRGVQFSWQALYKACFHPFTFSSRTPSEWNSDPNNSDWAKQQVDQIAHQKLLVAVKMCIFFFIVIVTDVGMASIVILLNALDVHMGELTYESVVAFVSSWILFHVLVMYELLDMFLRELKKAKFVAYVQTTAKDNNADRNKNLMDYLKDFDDLDSQSDLVKDGLESEYQTHPLQSLSQTQQETRLLSVSQEYQMKSSLLDYKS